MTDVSALAKGPIRKLGDMAAALRVRPQKPPTGGSGGSQGAQAGLPGLQGVPGDDGTLVLLLQSQVPAKLLLEEKKRPAPVFQHQREANQQSEVSRHVG